MDISSFLKKSEGKNIFILDGNNKLAINSYKDELINHLKAKYDLEIKLVSPDQIVSELQNQSCFGKTLVLCRTAKLPLEMLSGVGSNLLILELDGKASVKIPRSSNLLYVLLQKKSDIFTDLIKYYANKHSIPVKDDSVKALVNYFFANDFSIEHEIIKLRFQDKIAELNSYSINKLFQSLLYSDVKSFFKEYDNFTDDESMLLIRSLLRNFNIILEYLIKIRNGIPREIATQEAKNLYDDRALNYVTDGKLNIDNMILVLKLLMELEKKYKTSALEKRLTLLYGLTNIFILIKNSKLNLENL